MTRPRFERPRRLVVKVGSSSLRRLDGTGVDHEVIDALTGQIAVLMEAGTEVVLVSSGAVAAGMARLGWAERPEDLAHLQAAASVGQGALVHTYAASFAVHGLHSGQVLLTPSDVVDRGRYLNARATLETLLAVGAVPVVNENDAVATDELRFGDNDRLAALVASMLGAEVLVLLSDVDGLYASAAAARSGDGAIVERVDDVADYDRAGIAGTGSVVGSGGMVTKLDAARIATFSGASAVICNARAPGALAAAAAGDDLGTWFPPARSRPDARKLWIAFAPQPEGRIHVDAGAADALRRRGSSLLAAGVTAVEGEFATGAAVDVIDDAGAVMARGLTSHDAEAIRKIRGASRDEIAAAHPSGLARAVIHRDHLVVVSGAVRSPRASR